MAFGQKTYLPGKERDGLRKVPAMRGLRVLIAHHHPMFRHHLRNGLKSLGFAVTEVEDGYGLLDALAAEMSGDKQSGYPHLIVADVNLPGSRSIHILADLRRDGVKIPFILLASGPTRVTARQVRELHRAVLVTLPVHWGFFLSSLYALLYDAGDFNIRGPGYGRSAPIMPPAWLSDQLIEKRVSKDQEHRARERIIP